MTGTVSELRFVSLGEQKQDDHASAAEAAENELERAEEERRQRVAAEVEAARQETRRQMQQTADAQIERLAQESARRVEWMAQEFARDRQRYFAAAEAHVVELALAIARRVLAREVKETRLHLGDTVKAALSKVQDQTTTVLVAAPGEQAEWESFLSRWAPSVLVRGDQQVAPGACYLETSIGRIELSVEIQLAEVERAFNELSRQQGAR